MDTPYRSVGGRLRAGSVDGPVVIHSTGRRLRPKCATFTQLPAVQGQGAAVPVRPRCRARRLSEHADLVLAGVEIAGDHGACAERLDLALAQRRALACTRDVG